VTADLREISGSISHFVSAIVQDALVAFYEYDSQIDQLVRVAADGPAAGVALQRIWPGQGVSGWVAANRRPMANSDAALDLGDDAARANPPLRFCVSVPIVHDNELLAVLTVYAPNAFSESDQGLIEMLADELAPVLHAVRRPLASQERHAVQQRRPAV
jgi:GAF domain-containing protein